MGLLLDVYMNGGNRKMMYHPEMYNTYLRVFIIYQNEELFLKKITNETMILGMYNTMETRLQNFILTLVH